MFYCIYSSVDVVEVMESCTPMRPSQGCTCYLIKTYFCVIPSPPPPQYFYQSTMTFLIVQTQHTQNTNGKVTTSQIDITHESKEVSPFQASSGHKASINRRARMHNKNKTEITKITKLFFFYFIC